MRATLLALVGMFAVGAPGAGQADTGYSARDAQQGAQLRSDISAVISALYHPCGSSDEIVPAMVRYEALRDGQVTHRRKIDFAVVRADYDYQMSLVDILCAEFSEAEQREVDELNAAVAETTMDRIDAVLKKLAEEAE